MPSCLNRFDASVCLHDEQFFEITHHCTTPSLLRRTSKHLGPPVDLKNGWRVLTNSDTGVDSLYVPTSKLALFERLLIGHAKLCRLVDASGMLSEGTCLGQVKRRKSLSPPCRPLAVLQTKFGTAGLANMELCRRLRNTADHSMKTRLLAVVQAIWGCKRLNILSFQPMTPPT